ncbi:Fic family protein [Mucilaginibacter conchicola]|uniref:Fic family protein n=1 Tax=Mucilaginibacter conchicola TaxID=2303333 RepID=A0A372NQ53_9SPHI|nr:Fic family protein [Mucilaginibacter conchicola]RFZ91064.1 Fic family protein [Mucilaginibacter conchicola]
MYIYQQNKWPEFIWDSNALLVRLGEVRHHQGKILGLMSQAGFKLQEETLLDTLTLDVTKSSEIEGEKLNTDQVRSSIARRLGIEQAGMVTADRNVDGVVEMMLDATQNYKSVLNEDRLYAWHAALFPTGRSGMHKITVGNWRSEEAGPMRVVSGAMGKEKIHFEAPGSDLLPAEMEMFLKWFNEEDKIDPVIKAGIAHLWFVTVHPFDDGNGRITRALTDLLLARADGTSQRFYSMSAQILRERNSYYDILENTQKGGLDVTPWLNWFLDCLFNAMQHTEVVLKSVSLRNRFWEKHRRTSLNERQQKMLHILLDDFFGSLTTVKWGKIARCSADTALRDINDLIEKGILGKEAGGSKNTTYRLFVGDDHL